MTTSQEIDLSCTMLTLGTHQKGRATLRRILEWMDNEGLGLDSRSKTAAIKIIQAIWENPGSARDHIREALDQ